MTHTCTEWRTQIEWRKAVTTADQDWQVEQQVRVRRCTACDREKSAQPTRLRRRSRSGLTDKMPPELLLVWIPPQQWRSIEQILKLSGGNRLELEQQLGQWLNQGWLEVEEQQDRYRSQWQFEKVRLSQAARQVLIEQPQVQRDADHAANLADTLVALDGWRADLAKARRKRAGNLEIKLLMERLETVLDDQEQALREGQWKALTGTNQLVGGAPHQRWVRILRGLLNQLTEENWEYERAFSARWLGHSKELSRDRKQIEQYLELPLERLGIFRHTPVVLCWGKFTSYFEDQPIIGQAGTPFVALSAQTVGRLTEVQVSASAVLIIENQTAFEALLRPPLRNDNYLYLYSGGYAGSAERALLATWLKASPELPWFVWADWDVDGIGIQADWQRWAETQDLSAPHPWLWEEERLAQWLTHGKALNEKQRNDLAGLRHPLAEQLLRFGRTLEQENVLSYLSVVHLG